MKKLYLMMAAATVWLSAIGQSSTDYRAMMHANIRSLDLYGYLQYRLRTSDSTFSLVDMRGKPEITVRWDHIGALLTRLNTWPVEESIRAFEHKKLTEGLSFEKRYKPKEIQMKGLVLAIDPGHMAGNREEAIWEDKYVKVHSATGEIFFYEAQLTELTAAIVEAELQKRGVIVVLSRSFGNTSFGKSYKQWLQDDFKTSLMKELSAGNITELEYKSFSGMNSSYDSMFVFHHYFKNLEFRQRLKNLDDANPDLAINIHYNAHEKDIRDAQGFNKPVSFDYSMAFAPGAFLPSELKTTRDKLDFLRLLFSKSIEHSIKLSDLILQHETRTVGIKPVSYSEFNPDDLHAIATNKPGVMLRNLAMNRILRCPVSYLEALLQDCENEIPLLTQKDYSFYHPDMGEVHAPYRCKQVADAIVRAVEDYCRQSGTERDLNFSIKTPQN
jgi:N-acetylmuramoyl-L-alanine amidase